MCAIRALTLVSTMTAALLCVALNARAGDIEPSRRIAVDQLGYLPDARKTVFVRRPIVGWDGVDSSLPGDAIEIRRVDDNTLVATAPLVPWNAGNVHETSGDKVWRADISDLQTPGRYRAVDPISNDVGPAFVISTDPYREVARAAQRMYYYQRCGTPKLAEHAGAAYADDASHTGDTSLRWIVEPLTSTAHDLSGGWYDAGDYNKYINIADDVIHELLDAYVTAPDLWTDDTNIPESGNGRSDLLDEIAWELDWFRKMQLADGSVLHKVSSASYGGTTPPSTDTTTRYYARVTATATMSTAGAFAHAAVVFGNEPDAASQALAADLTARAELAWNWVESNPAAWAETYDNDGGLFTTTAAEDDTYLRTANRIRAAVYLFQLTQSATYRSVIDADYQAIHVFSWFSTIPYEYLWHAMLLDYASTAGATPAVTQDIRDMIDFAISRDVGIGRWQNDEDAYHAWISDGDYVWGSNRVRAHQGSTMSLALRFDLESDPLLRRDFRDATAGYLHALHGVNPQSHAFLTALGSIDVERSVNEVYHGWFSDGTIWDNAETSLHGPPPGYVTGGPNRYFAPANGSVNLEPPMNQPPLKSYLDWNADWPENSWQITECHIPYQSAYIRLLADVVANASEACAAEWDGAPGLAVSDLLAFLAEWFAGTVDLNGDGQTNISDLLTYLSAYFAGCD